jgi:dipeptidyl aminopeptidase/acylaminoacyl peptidase
MALRRGLFSPERERRAAEIFARFLARRVTVRRATAVVLPFAAGVGASASCSGGSDFSLPTTSTPTETSSSAGPPLLLWRGRTGNPPRFDLALLGMDGRELQVVVSSATPGGVRPRLFDTPAWSPDGDRIAFTADLSEAYGQGGFPKKDVFTVAVDGSELQRLTDNGRSSSPVWSPDAQAIVFEVRGDFPQPTTLEDYERMSSALWTMRTDGAEQRQLLEASEGEFVTPAGWPPDGAHFLFTRTSLRLPTEGPAENPSAIYVANADGTGVRRLADRSASPSWSPDGTQIAFVGDRDENGSLNYGDLLRYANELYVMQADRSKPRRVTNTANLNEREPAWSSEGSLIAYQRGEVVGNAEGTGAFAIRPDGSCGFEVAYDRE